MRTNVQTREMLMNTTPVVVEANDKTQTNQATEGYNVFTIAPRGNFSVDALLTYGADSKVQQIPAGCPLPFPIIQQFNNSIVNISNRNTQENTALLSGWFALSTSPNFLLQNNPTELKQYKSAGVQATSGIQTLTLTARSVSASLAIVIVGANKPVPVFLNTNKADLPPAWQNLENAVFETGNTFQETKNFFGQTVYIVNVSLTEEATLTARFQ